LRKKLLLRLDVPLPIVPAQRRPALDLAPTKGRVAKAILRSFTRPIQGQRRLAGFGGSKSATSALRASARMISSESATQRSCASILESVARLNSSPSTEQRAANISWVRPLWYRKRRTCGPTTLRGLFFVWTMLQIRSVTLLKTGLRYAPYSERHCARRTIASRNPAI
jgi:hypothetical protein